MARTTSPLSAQEKLTLLGYPPDARLLIVNGDDLGMCHAANAATFAALEGGLMTAASLMLPCPWAFAACAYLREHPDLDVGVHLTLTSEWERYRWGPLLGAAGDPLGVPSLCDRWGMFPEKVNTVLARADPADVSREAEAQIERALAWGVDPTNLDGHMGTIYADPRYLAIYLDLARRYRLPLRMPTRRMYVARGGSAAVYDGLDFQGLLTNDDLRFVDLEDPPALEEQLIATLHGLEPGITEICAHVAQATPEARAAMADWQARVEAFRLLTEAPSIREELARAGITRIGWRELRDAQRRL